MKVYAYMEHGSGKEVSEDAMLVNGLLLKDGYVACSHSGTCVAIADGVGGNAGGKEASEFVLQKCNEGLAPDARNAVIEINNALLQYANTFPGMEQMATTLSAIIFAEEKPIGIVHIGNTRISAIQGDYLKQLTTDHTTSEWLRSRGDDEAAEQAPKNEITGCLGSGNAARLSQLQTRDIDREYGGFIISSDGIHDYLNEEVIEDFIGQHDYSEKAFQELFNMASDAGSTDDKSMIVIRLWE